MPRPTIVIYWLWRFFDQTLANRPFMTPIEQRDIPLVERVVVTHLTKEDGRIAGAAGFRLDGFPVCDLTHDGTIMAYHIGAKVTGKEWNDGHTTRSVNAAACYGNWGDMFSRILSTNGVDVHHDLGVDMNCRAYRAGNPDAGGSGPAQSTHEITSGSSMPEEFHRNFGSDGDDGPPTWDGKGGVPGSPPPGFAASSNVGGATAGMAIHKSEGLVPFDDRCATNIPGPYAAGDALGSHMSGGIYIQIGSSLTGSAVQGAIAGEAAAEYASEADTPVTPGVKIIEIVDEILAPLRRVAGYGPAWVTQPLLDIMILSAEMKCGRH